MLPLPASQVVPPSVEYSQVVSESRPVTEMVPRLETPSLLRAPESARRAKPMPSGVMVSISGRPRAVEEVLPALSVKEATTVMDSVPANSFSLAV